MKKIFMLIMIPYLLLVGFIFYIFFGPGIVAGYRPLKWKGIETMVPGNFSVNTYRSKGWEVYSLEKSTVFIKIALQPAFDVSTLPAASRKVLYRFSPEPGTIYYISNPRKTYEVVFARVIDDVTLYFSVSSPSVFSSRIVMAKITAGCFYRGKPIAAPKPSIPLKAYITDFILLGSMLLPFIVITIIFYLSGKKPASTYFIGDPIRFEESYVYYTSVRKFGRKNSFCYLVLTATRLMIFMFGRPSWESRLYEGQPGIKIEGKKIIIQKEKEKIVVKPSEIKKWQEVLSSYVGMPPAACPGGQ